MKLTKLRDKDGTKLGAYRLALVQYHLENALTNAGYETAVTQVNSSRIDIGMHMCCFRINIALHGYNARYNPFMNYSKGYKRTSTPTWDQRVDFNNIVNQVLDRLKIAANVRSGPYVIRLGIKSMTETDWVDQTPNYITENEARGFRVLTLPESETA